MGSTSTIAAEEGGLQNPIVVFVEPDADNDGFGDETQDQCPQSAAVQSPCPVIALSSSATAQKGLAQVLVTSNQQASVTVAGTVNLGKGKTAKLNGGTQIVAPGTIAKFTLLFTQRLKTKLKQLSRKRFLWLNLTSTAPNVVGPPTVSSLKVKLKGQAKPKPKKRGGRPNEASETHRRSHRHRCRYLAAVGEHRVCGDGIRQHLRGGFRRAGNHAPPARPGV
ncbi:MAG TPA: hypothetical protein VD741_06635 [Solirubrobacterales bacterium]|nr:hypothetical protein [Solirubrobacterales bacterium]